MGRARTVRDNHTSSLSTYERNAVIARQMSSFETRCEAISRVTNRWREPEYSTRREAVDATLEASNRWTQEALNYALNRWMQGVTTEALSRWLGEKVSSGAAVVGVLHGESDPLDGFRALLAIVAHGYDYVGHVPDASPELMPAFVGDLAEHIPELELEFSSREGVLGQSSALVAQPKWESLESLRAECDDYDLPADRALIHPERYAVGVLDGQEGTEQRDRFAEDLLLYEGGGHQRLAILWAPRDLEPDPYLQAMARFRGAFPGHPDTPGALEMKKAFLEARDEPHAYAAGLEFLVSRGEPEPQSPGHFRWVEYDDLEDVKKWLDGQTERVSAIVARETLHDQLLDSRPLRTPGDLHVPPLDDEEGTKIADFVRSLQ